MKYSLYRFLRPIIKVLMKLVFRLEIVNKENIPKSGPYILAGNHKSNFDCLAIMSSTKETVRFLAKKELLDGKFAWLFRKMGIIPVDRKNKNKEALMDAKRVLTEGGVIGIFPEATFNNTEYVMRPFKMGAVKMASDTSTKIVPFAIVGEYKLFRKTKVVIGKPYKIKNKDLKGENITLMNKVIRLLKK